MVTIFINEAVPHGVLTLVAVSSESQMLSCKCSDPGLHYRSIRSLRRGLALLFLVLTVRNIFSLARHFG